MTSMRIPATKLNHVVRGAHYGHPYVVPNEPGVEASGFRDPIHLSELESNYLGMAYATSTELPAEYRNCIYMADFMQNRIWRLKLVRSGDTYTVAEISPFATLSTPVDVAAGPSGELFVISRRTQNVYRIRYRDAADQGLTMHQATSSYPLRWLALSVVLPLGTLLCRRRGSCRFLPTRAASIRSPAVTCSALIAVPVILPRWAFRRIWDPICTRSVAQAPRGNRA